MAKVTHPTRTLQIRECKDGTYDVVIHPSTYAAVCHVTGFATEEEAQAWIENESATWLAKAESAHVL